MTLETDALHDRTARRRTLSRTSVEAEASAVLAAGDAPIDTGWMRLLHRHVIDSRDDDVPVADRTPLHDVTVAGASIADGTGATPPAAIRTTRRPGTTDDGEVSSASRASTFLTATALALCALIQLLLIDMLVTPARGDTRNPSVRTARATAASPSSAMRRDARAGAPAIPETSRACRGGAVVDGECTFQ
jgi:hypothetical protein